tara:strand:+ start:229 stop:591 length:363 start_codon:yes stop_codon:yes gene_type:complete
MSESVRDDRVFKFEHPETIDTSTSLRMMPTRLNPIDRDNTELFGTAPYRAGRTADAVDTESVLRFSEHERMNVFEKTATERNFQFVDDVYEYKNAVDSGIRGRSTRVDMRNQNAQNMNCR